MTTPEKQILIISIPVLAILIAVASLSRKRFNLLSLSCTTISVVLAGFVLASYSAMRTLDLSIPLGSKEAIGCVGRVAGDASQREWGIRFDLDLEECGAKAASGTVRVNAGSRYLDDDVLAGDLISVPLVFSRPREFRNPGSFSYGRYLMSRGVGAVASARGRVDLLERDEGNPFAGMARGLRGRIAGDIRSSASPEVQGILEALATGKREGIDEATRKTFSASGLSHLLAISGLHVGYVALMIYLLIRFTLGRVPAVVSRVPVARLAAAVTLPLIWFYIAFIGVPMSAVRAGLMLTVYLVGVVAGLRQDGPTTLAAAVIFVLIAMPLSILDLSFGLSVAAVAGIMLLAIPLIGRVSGTLEGRGSAARLGSRAFALFILSFSAAAFTAPLVAYHFKSFSALGPLANVIAVPLVAFLLMPAILLASTLTAMLPWLAPLAWKGAAALASLLARFAEYVAERGETLVGAWAPSPFEVVLSYAVLIVAAGLVIVPRRRTLAMAAALSVAVCVDVTTLNVMPLLGDTLTVTSFDVGQGESSLVEFPDGTRMLIDGGGLRGSSFDIGERVLMPALLAMGVSRIDSVLVTHPHFDHFGGLGFLIERYRPEVVWVNGMRPEGEEGRFWDEFLSRAESAGATVEVVSGKVERRKGSANFVIASTSPDPSAALNDTSLVARIDHGSKSFLFTGDLEELGEARLIESGIDIDVDVLQVGHHGSRDATTEEFLAKVTPRVAVISAGRDNRYGLPNDETISRLEEAGSDIYRTDLHGAITITSDGHEIEVETFMKDD